MGITTLIGPNRRRRVTVISIGMSEVGGQQLSRNTVLRPQGVPHQRLDIQGLRAVAVLAVVVFHAGAWLPGGFVGVDVFFVISGFVITAMLAREHASHGRVRYGRFYLRRFQRLTPALAVLVLAVLLVSSVLLPPLGTQQETALTGAGALLLIANGVIAVTTGGYFDNPAEGNALLNTWSLSVEEQFYLVFPLLLGIGWRMAQRRRAGIVPLVLVGALGVASFIVAMLGTVGFYSPVARGWEFAAGALLALGSRRRARAAAPPLLRTGAALAGAGAVVAGFVCASSTSVFPGPLTTLPVLGTVLLIWAGGSGTNPVTSALSRRPLVAVGDWSYSIYLWHWPTIVFARVLWPEHGWAAPAGAVVSVLPALVSYYCVEQRFRAKQIEPGRRAPFVFVTVATPMVAALVLLVAASHAYWLPGQQPLADVVQTNHAATDCAVQEPVPDSCVFNADGAQDPVYLVGDSTADHFTEAAIGASVTLDRPLRVTLLKRCPFKDVFVDNPDVAARDTEACRDGYEEAMDQLTAAAPGTVVISELNSWYRQDDTRVGRSLGAMTSAVEPRAEILEAGLSATVARLMEAGHRVVLVQAAPTWEGTFDPRECSLMTLIADSCQATMTRASADERQALERASLARIAERSGAAIWDPRDFFCSEDTCSTTRAGLPLYRDSIHVSVESSKGLASDLALALSAAH